MEKRAYLETFFETSFQDISLVIIVSDMVSVKQGLNPNILNVNYIFKHMYKDWAVADAVAGS